MMSLESLLSLINCDFAAINYTDKISTMLQ